MVDKLIHQLAISQQKRLRNALLVQESSADRIKRHTRNLVAAQEGKHPDPFVQYLYNSGVDVTHQWSDWKKIQTIEDPALTETPAT